jgi:hypothetical protein
VASHFDVLIPPPDSTCRIANIARELGEDVGRMSLAHEDVGMRRLDVLRNGIRGQSAPKTPCRRWRQARAHRTSLRFHYPCSSACCGPCRDHRLEAH